MKTVWSLVLVGGSILAGAAFQTAPNAAQEVAPADELSRRFIRTTTGTVRSYSAGERIVIVSDDGNELAMELDAGARVDDSIAEGETVTIAWLVDSLDRPRVTSIAATSPAPAQAGSAPPSKAYASSMEGGTMSTTPSGPAASTPRPTVTGGAEYVMTPGRGYATPTPGPPPPAPTRPPGNVPPPGNGSK